MDNCVFFSPPPDFNPVAEAAGCYCEWNDKLLFLRRSPQKSQGNTWGVPGGKLEKEETHRMAVIREVSEEVGLDIDHGDLQMLGTIYCRLPTIDYIYHIFRKPFMVVPHITLALEEHLEARWVTFNEALELPLIAGGMTALHFYRDRSQGHI